MLNVLKHKRTKFLGGFCLVAIVAVTLWLKGYKSLDPDFGWHLKMGQIIRESGIPKGDPLSYTMSSFPFVDHEWLTNVAISFLHPVIGMSGLAAISSAIVLMSLVIALMGRVEWGRYFRKASSNKANTKQIGAAVVMVLSATVVLPFAGIRPQVQSWLFLSILLWLLFKKGVWEKWRFAVPALMIIWTNLHGSYAVGIAVLFFVVGIRWLRHKMVRFGDVLTLLFTGIVTFVNPYGIRLWGEFWQQLSDDKLRWTIVEWMPSVLVFKPANVIAATFFTMFVWRYRKKFKLEELGLYFIFLIQGILSRRHVPLWVIVAIPMAIASLNYFYQEVSKIPGAINKLQKVYRAAWLGSVGVLLLHSYLTIQSTNNLSESVYYPRVAVSYLKSDLSDGRLFSPYNWGGYLIWKLPEKKVFVDGRMPSWRWDEAPEGESGAAFDDFREIVAGNVDYVEAFENYDIDTVLWPVPRKPTVYDSLQKKLDNFLAGFGKEKNEFDFIEQLENDGWNEVYKDNVAVIYFKPD